MPLVLISALFSFPQILRIRSLDHFPELLKVVVMVAYFFIMLSEIFPQCYPSSLTFFP
jgi:hypothetical protein